ncbi:MAG TPA: hypothetical protein PKI59_04770, partial [Candidatus Cloacimonadota bacterium]|nr:hypothetical protein [Candidatus Cloacimonadota bacterium]
SPGNPAIGIFHFALLVSSFNIWIKLFQQKARLLPGVFLARKNMEVGGCPVPAVGLLDSHA